jgi:hypothetical protein
MAKQIIYKTDIEPSKFGFEASVFITDHNTVKIFIEDPNEDWHSAWMDFNKESLNELIKDLKKLSKELE